MNNNQNTLITELANHDAAIVANLNINIAELSVENRQLKAEIQDLQTKLKMAKSNHKPLSKSNK